MSPKYIYRVNVDLPLPTLLFFMSTPPPTRARPSPKIIRVSVPPAIKLHKFSITCRHDESDAEVIFQLDMQNKPHPDDRRSRFTLEQGGQNLLCDEEDTKLNITNELDATVQPTNNTVTGSETASVAEDANTSDRTLTEALQFVQSSSFHSKTDPFLSDVNPVHRRVVSRERHAHQVLSPVPVPGALESAAEFRKISSLPCLVPFCFIYISCAPFMHTPGNRPSL